ncbi:MAG: hypothetical protein IPP14_14255 [Planctomycetes bacterium]|nr:hypothetical protein [Planctomycetota bacterium]
MSGGNPYQQQPGGYPQQPNQYPQQPAGYPPQQQGGYQQQAGGYPPQGYQQPYGQPGMPAQAPYPGAYLQPHRGTMLIIFAICSWFVCLIFGIVAFIMAGKDLEAMKSGQMDPSGMGITKAARLVSLIHFIFFAVIMVIYVVAIVVVGANGGFRR